VLLSRRHRWAAVVAGSLFVRHYGAVFEGFVDGRQWFLLVDLGTEVVCGVLGALVGLPSQQGTGCAALKIAMVAVTVTYAVALAVLRPSNTLMDAAVTAVNAGMGAAVAIVVLLQGPGIGAQLMFAQGIFAVCTALLPSVVFVLTGLGQRRLPCGPPGRSSSDVDEGDSPRHSPAEVSDDGSAALLLLYLGEIECREPAELVDAEDMPLLCNSSTGDIGDGRTALEETDVTVPLQLLASDPRSDLELLYEAAEDTAARATLEAEERGGTRSPLTRR
jgi:hypothetical protein